MGLLNSIGQGLSQAGYAAGDIFAKQAAAEQSSIMELERQKRLAEFQAELKNAPLKRYGAILKDEAGKDVTEPGKTTEVAVDVPSEFIGGNNTGIENTKGLLNSPPTTRKRTQDEAMTAANARAMQDDPEAYAEYESRIGKPLREERKLDDQERKNEASAAAAAKRDQTTRDRDERRWQVELAKLDLQGKNLEAQNKKIDAMISHWERSDENKANAETKNPERLYSVVNAMNQTIRDLNEKKPTTRSSPEDAAEWKRQYDTALRVRDRASSLLDLNLTERGAPEAAPKPTPAPKPGAAPANRPPLSSFMK